MDMKNFAPKFKLGIEYGAFWCLCADVTCQTASLEALVLAPTFLVIMLNLHQI